MRGKFSQSIVRAVLKFVFRLRLQGVENIPAQGPLMIVANHVSFLDPLLLAAFLPEVPAFAMNTQQAAKWYFKPLLKCTKVFILDPTQPLSAKSIVQHVKDGGRVVVFPEGRITVTGGLMKIYEGTGMMAARAGAPVLPVHIEGAERSLLSRLQGKVNRRLFPRISLHFGQPVILKEDSREQAAARIHAALSEAAFHARYTPQTIGEALVQAASTHGWRTPLLTDTQATLTYRKLLLRAFALARGLDRHIKQETHIGVLLPTSLACAVTFFALHTRGKVPCMLNFSAGERALRHACELAGAKTVLTSRAFIEKAQLQGIVEALKRDVKIIYLEDIRTALKVTDKLTALAQAYTPRFAHNPQATAVVLYTSGSEGAPKGVALTHANILANIRQVQARFDFTRADVMLNALPMFHSFGLTVGALLPLLLGIRAVLYPSPLHYRVIPEIAYDQSATILLGTDTFFNGYANYANNYDFFRVRLAVAGAEKLKESTWKLYAERFRVNILQGYGVTETSPVLACNTPTHHRLGSVGLLFPGIEHKLEPVEGLQGAGRLWVKGPNIMHGYLGREPNGEWYDTGDIVRIDEDGYLFIEGRAKRFAKIGGEMVSLASIEDMAATLWPESAHAAISQPDARKGETIVLFSENPAATREAYAAHAKAHGVAEIALPKRVEVIEALPRLGNGKVDYPALNKPQGKNI